MVKMQIRATSLQFHARKAKSSRNIRAALERKQILINQKIAENDQFFEDYDQQNNLIKGEIEEICMHKANVRVRVRFRYS